MCGSGCCLNVAVMCAKCLTRLGTAMMPNLPPYHTMKDWPVTTRDSTVSAMFVQPSIVAYNRTYFSLIQ